MRFNVGFRQAVYMADTRRAAAHTFASSDDQCFESREQDDCPNNCPKLKSYACAATKVGLQSEALRQLPNHQTLSTLTTGCGAVKPGKLTSTWTSKVGNIQDPPCTLNWGYMVPSSGYLGPNRG